jgi:inhibitor of growth protein 4
MKHFSHLKFILFQGLENLSPELTRNFKLMHDLDQRVQGSLNFHIFAFTFLSNNLIIFIVKIDLLNDVEKMKHDYLNNMKSMDPEDRSSHLKVIEKKFEKCKEFSDEKVQLANQTYEMVIIFTFIRKTKKKVSLVQNRLIFHRLISIYAVWMPIWHALKLN